MHEKRLALGLARRMDIDRALLAGYTKYNECRGQNRFGSVGMAFDVDDRIREFSLSPADVEGEVLLPMTQGQDGHLSYSYAILGHAFRTRGYRPIFPLCDGELPLCLRKEPRGKESRSDAKERDHPSTCAICNYYGRELLSAFGHSRLSLSSGKRGRSDEIDQREPGEEEHYRGVDVAKFTTASARRYLKKKRLDHSDPFENDIYRRFRSAVLSLVDVAHDIYQNRDVSAVVAHHPVYAYGGVYLEVAEQYDVPAVSIGVGYNDGTIIFGNQGNRSPIPTFTDQSYLEEVVSAPLSKEAEVRIEEIMAKRASGTDLRVDTSADGNANIETASDDLVVGLFTNLTWDAAVETDSIVYGDTYDWIGDTIEKFGNHDSITLVLKPHPAEALRGTKQPVVEWVRQNHDPVPDNLTLLESNTDVDTYSIMDELDAGIVFSSTVGLEMAYHGVPVVVINDTHYRGLGFTFDPETRDDYVAFVDECGTLTMNEEMKRRARRYAHFLFVQKQHSFPYYTQEDLDIELRPVTHEELVPGNEPFDTIVERILAGGPVVQERAW